MCTVLTEALECEQGFGSWRNNVKLWRGCGVENFQQMQAWRQISVVTTAWETADVLLLQNRTSEISWPKSKETFRCLNINSAENCWCRGVGAAVNHPERLAVRYGRPQNSNPETFITVVFSSVVFRLNYFRETWIPHGGGTWKVPYSGVWHHVVC
jgi:hypothetical protein